LPSELASNAFAFLLASVIYAHIANSVWVTVTFWLAENLVYYGTVVINQLFISRRPGVAKTLKNFLAAEAIDFCLRPAILCCVPPTPAGMVFGGIVADILFNLTVVLLAGEHTISDGVLALLGKGGGRQPAGLPAGA